MSHHAIHPVSVPAGTVPLVKSVGLTAPLQWLRAGIQDVRSAPLHSLGYGLLFTAACGLFYALARELPWLTLGLLTGLLLVGPLLAAGIYVAARQLEAGERVSIRAALTTLSSRRTNLALYGLFLALVMVAWVRFSSLLFAIKFSMLSPSVEGYLGILSGDGDPMVLAYFVGIGFLLAILVFVTSAVSVPLIIDRDSDPFTAIRTSARAVTQNWPAMALWAAIIVVLTAVGIATLGLAMVALFPILGYATWHSYRALVE